MSTVQQILSANGSGLQVLFNSYYYESRRGKSIPEIFHKYPLTVSEGIINRVEATTVKDSCWQASMSLSLSSTDVISMTTSLTLNVIFSFYGEDERRLSFFLHPPVSLLYKYEDTIIQISDINIFTVN